VWPTHCRHVVRTEAEFLVKGIRIDEYEDVGEAGGSFGTSLVWNSSNNTEE
jgi:hypothetical protein